MGCRVKSKGFVLGDSVFVIFMLVCGKSLIFPDIDFLILRMGLKTTIISISQDFCEDQINSHVKQTYGSEIPDLPDPVRFHLAPHSQAPSEA